jgi:DNA (cytosine-5)-methyltransferase 1
MKPKLLDLFCGAGGAAMGYHRAGFEVVGVDIKPQPRYPFEFHQGDAMSWPLEGFDAIHASPPCQGESILRNLPWLKDRDYPMLIIPTRERLLTYGIPYVIENVFNARRSPHKPSGMQAGYLCGQMFGLPLYRHRLFETSFFWLQPGHPQHRVVIGQGRMLNDRRKGTLNNVSAKGAWGNQPIVTVGGGQFLKAAGERALGINWMNRNELKDAIPPAYTEYIGKLLLEALR